jgi:hypothetical protein
LDENTPFFKVRIIQVFEDKTTQLVIIMKSRLANILAWEPLAVEKSTSQMPEMERAS